MADENEETTVIRTQLEPHEADMLAQDLRNMGVSVSVLDDHLNSTMPHYSSALGGVKLLVFRKDAERVNKTLQEMQRSKIEGLEAREKKCPECGSSNDIRMRKLSWWLLVLFLVTVTAPLLFYRRPMVCRNCGYRW